MMIVTRFAPSPTGLLHLGHAYSALLAYEFACSQAGRFLVRIEDIDTGRCRPAFITAIIEDLTWLGLKWEQPVRLQSQHMADYQQALQRLEAQGLLYPCFCSRADIAASSGAPQGPDGPIYPGTCRTLSAKDIAAKQAAGLAFAVRLDVGRAIARTGQLAWYEALHGQVVADPLALGDVVLARKDVPTSYHLAVTVDDALQGVTHVIRGADLGASTHIHRLLQALLGLPTPLYQHHQLLVDAEGERLAKRRGSPSLQMLRAAGETPATIRARLGLRPTVTGV